MKTIHVVAAIIQHQNEILCVQRGESKLHYISKKWEFPGGKVEKGESEEDALIREIKEELHMDITNLQFHSEVDHSYPDFRIIMRAYHCLVATRELTLTEHLNFEWSKKSDLSKFDWAAADIPIVDLLIKQ